MILSFSQVVASEPVNFAQKMMVWIEKKWNPCDLVVIIFFLVGLALRLNPATRDYGRVIYCLDIMYWYIRSLDFLSVNKYLGPYVTMIGKMVRITLPHLIFPPPPNVAHRNSDSSALF